MPAPRNVAPRNVTPMIKALRDCLLGRRYKNHLRYEGRMSARTLPKPRLPTGPAHKMANIYYADRNFRSLVTPPEVVFEASAKGLESGQEGLGPPRKKPVTPGFSFNWRTGKPNTQ